MLNMDCKNYGLSGAVARQKQNVYIPKKLSFDRYIEDVDNLHPSNKGHQQIAQELFTGNFND